MQEKQRIVGLSLLKCFDAVVNWLHTAEGQSLVFVEAPEGSYLMTLTDPSFGEKMFKADDIITKWPQAGTVGHPP